MGGLKSLIQAEFEAVEVASLACLGVTAFMVTVHMLPPGARSCRLELHPRTLCALRTSFASHAAYSLSVFIARLALN